MITVGQVTASTASSVLAVVPPGNCTIVASNAGTVTAWMGVIAAGGTLTTSNAFPLSTSGYPVSFPGYAGSPGATLRVVTAAGSAPIGYVLSTAAGGTGP